MATIIDLGQKVKEKYPGAYDNVDDAELGRKVQQKYPGAYDSFTEVSGANNQPAAPKPTLPPVPQKSTLGKVGSALGNALIGVAKGAGSTVSSLGTLGQKALEKVTKPAIESVTNKPFQAQPTLTDEFGQDLKPKGIAQKFGFGAEQIGEFFIPGGAATKVGKAAEAAAGASKLAKVAGFGARVAAEAATGAGVVAAQGGSKKDIKNAAIIGGALPVAGKVLGTLGSGAKESAKYISSTLSGVPKAAIEQAFKNPEAVQNAITKATQEGGEATGQKIYNQTINALNTLKKARSDVYGANLGELEKSISRTKDGTMYVKRVLSDAEAAATRGYIPGTEIGVPTKLTTGGIKNVFTRTLKEFGAEGGGLKNIDYTNVALDDAHLSKLDKLQQRIYNWTDTTPTGINRLRQVVDSYKIGGINPGSSESKFNKIIGDLRSNLSEYLAERVPQVRELNKTYAAQSEVIDNIVNQLKLGSNDPNTALRKLLNVFNPKSEIYRPIVQELGEKAGVDLMSDIAGLVMSKWTAEGSGQYITGLIQGAGGLAAFLNPTALLALPVSAAASSPQVIGQVVTKSAKAAKNPLVKGAKVVLPKFIRGAAIEASR